jgi:ribose/xylose/arabinose/galactoside ABC-type transport system permease subunit
LLYAAIADGLRNGWLLVALPCASMLVSLACIVVARALPVDLTLRIVGQQVKADIDMLHAARHS